MVKYWSTLQDEIKKAQDQRTRLSLPFDHFLHFLYMPPINIWKNPFNGEIDTTLIGIKYLENNPYWDIELIQQWTNFFKDMGTDKYNTITDITLWELKPETWWYFSLPLTVQFETPDRRAFLLLLNKLSVTSYTDNVSLINEFMFSLREGIKLEKKDKISEMLSWTTIPSQVKDQDDLIGYVFYQRVKNGSWNDLIDQDILNKTMIKVAWCVDQTSEECLYMFREKYRSIPLIAYGIGKENIDSVKWLQVFLQKLPPIINLDNFSFDKKSVKWKVNSDGGYRWSVSLRVYGKDLSDWEVDEISDKLGSLCFANKNRLSNTYVIEILNKLIAQLWKNYSMNEKRAKQLRQMMQYVESIEKDYETLANYKKVIKNFEVYRTIQEGNVCDVVASSNIPWIDSNMAVKSAPINLNNWVELLEEAVDDVNEDKGGSSIFKAWKENIISWETWFITPLESSSSWGEALSAFWNTTPIRRTVIEE